jgi:CRISPR-associated protein Cmr1
MATPRSNDCDTKGNATVVANDPLSILNYIGRQMVRYRSNGRVRDGERKTTLNEIAEQNFWPDHHWAKRPTTPGLTQLYDRRVAFGMPLGYNGCDLKWVLPEGHERRGSPLLIHVHRLGNGEHVGVATMLPARLVPPGATLRMNPDRVGPVLDANEMAVFEDSGAWDVLAGFIEGTRKTTVTPYFDRQKQIWPKP